MAEQEITYIPYGLDEISQQDLMTNLANGVSGYLDSKRWAKKDRYRQAWLAAYQDIMNHGLAGASNDTGIWTVNHRQDPIDLDAKSTLDREMYQDAAYYIQLQMSRMTPRKKEEEKKETLDKFDFANSFMNLLVKDKYGGNPDLLNDPLLGWHSQDPRGENGLRGTKNRRNAMIKFLQLYKEGLQGKNYNFEESPFTDINDVNNKIDAAIKALGTDTEDDDISAFNALGLNYKTFFSNGGNDASGYVDAAGNPLTYSQYYKQLNDAKTVEAKAKADAAKKKLALQQANRYNYATRSSIKMIGRNPQELISKYQNDLGLLQQLNKYAQTPKLTGDEWSDIVGAFNFYNSKGALLNLSKQELERFLGLRSYNGIGPGTLKKLPGVEGFYYDTRTGQVVKPGRTDLQVSQPINGLLELNSEENLRLLSAQRKLNDGWETEDWLRMGAMALDIAGGIAAWAGPFGTAISGGLGLTSLGTNLAADIADESMTKWDVAKNAGVNLGLAAVGMVPGLGLASKTGKWLTNIARWAPRLLTIQALKDTPEVYASIKKAVDTPSEVTNQDWKNIAYGLSIAAGLSRGAKGIVNNRKFKPAFSEGTKKQYSITTSKGKKTITLELVDKIKKLNPKNKEEYKLKVKEALKLADDETIDTKNLSVLGKTIKSKGIEIKEENVPSGLSAKAKAYREYLENKNNAVKENHRLLSRAFKTDYDIYKANTARSLPELGISNRIKDVWNPLSDKNLLRKGIVVKELPLGLKLSSLTVTLNTKNSAQSETKIPHSRNEIRKEYKDVIEKGKFSNNNLLEGNYKVGNFNITVGKNNKGEWTILTDVYSSNAHGPRPESATMKPLLGKFDNLAKVLKEIAKIVKESRKRANLPDSSGKRAGINHKEIGKILKDLKAKGWLKQGGSIDKPLDTTIEDFFKNNKL